MAANLQAVSSAKPVRDRILETSYELFSRRGIRAVGIDELIGRAGVAKATLYRHFPSKDALVIAFLERRERRWTIGWVEKEARRRASSPEDQLLAIFDAFDEWFRREDFEACSFINVLLELGPEHAAWSASVQHLENIRAIGRGLAEEAGLRRLLPRVDHPAVSLDRVAAQDDDERQVVAQPAAPPGVVVGTAGGQQDVVPAVVRAGRHLPGRLQ